MAIFNSGESDTLSTIRRGKTEDNADLYDEFDEYGINLSGPVGSASENRAGNFDEIMERNELLKSELFAHPENIGRPSRAAYDGRPGAAAELYNVERQAAAEAVKRGQSAASDAGRKKKGIVSRVANYLYHKYKRKQAASARAAADERPSVTKRKKRRKRIKRRIILIIAALLLLFIAFVATTLGKINHESIDESALNITKVKGYTNILLLGVDSRDMNDTEGTRTDAIMIVSINDKTKEVTMTSVYRDTYLKMGNTDDYDKITHAHAYGGPEMVIASLNEAMDTDIEDFMLVNFKGVADGIDYLGGIEVDVEDYEIEELNKFTTETGHTIGRESYGMVEAPGKQTLDGTQAVSYGRIRKGVGDDFKRTERMRTVMKKVMEKVNKLSIFGKISFLNHVLPEVKTDMSSLKVLRYALMLKSIEMKGSDGFPYNPTTGYRNGVSYVFAVNLAQDVTEMHNKLFGDASYEPSQTVQDISYNASAY